MGDHVVLRASDGWAPASGRWTAARKAELVAQAAASQRARERVIAEHGLTAEELDGWAARYAAYGQRGLLVRRAQLEGPAVTNPVSGVDAARRSRRVLTAGAVERRAS